MSGNQEIKKQNQRTLILLLLAFLLPVAAAWLVYINMGSTGETKNNGELIIPPRPLEGLKLITLAGDIFGGEQLKGNWHLVYIGDGPCEQACRDSLSKMHQTRLAQGKAMSRVRLLYIALDKNKTNGADKLVDTYSHLTVLTSEQSRARDVMEFFRVGNLNNRADEQLIYMIDPLGNLMMRYKHDVRLIGMIRDLEHLLKISQVG